MSDISARLHDYFDRQIAWFDTELAEFAEFAENITRENAEELLEWQQRHEREMRNLGEEFNSLIKEWQASDTVSETERHDLRTVAQHAAGLADQVRDALDRGSSRAGAEASALRRICGEIRVGKDILNRYRAGGADPPGYVDRQA